MRTKGKKGIKENPTTDSSIDAGIGLDSLHGILSNPRRRYIIQSLATYSQLTIGDTAEQLASLEQGKPIRDLSTQERKRVYVGLYQSHLPKLDAVDVVEWDSEEGTITRGPVFRVARDAMTASSEAIHGNDSLFDRVRTLLTHVRSFFAGGASA